MPYEDSIGALRDLLDAGKIRMAGISNASLDQIRIAQQILGVHLFGVVVVELAHGQLPKGATTSSRS